jgi:hypothetical protein
MAALISKRGATFEMPTVLKNKFNHFCRIIKMESTLLNVNNNRRCLISPISSSLENLIYDFECNNTELQTFKAPVTAKRKIEDQNDIPCISKRRFSNHASMAKTAVGLRELAKRMGK